jgi:fibrillarin-like pre-rRNA processing protein
MILSKRYFGVFEHNRDLYTLNYSQGSLFGERILKINNQEYRYWDPYKSKLSAALYKNIDHFPFRKDSNILYLGASFGNTVSFLSDICVDGHIFAIEKSVRSFKSLLSLAEQRKNVYPILEDANHPEKYEFFIKNIDIVYQDIAQKNQAEIFNKNVRYLANGGYGILALKTKAIDVTKSAKQVLEIERKKLKNVKETINIEPYEKEHYVLVSKYD